MHLTVLSHHHKFIRGGLDGGVWADLFFWFD